MGLRAQQPGGGDPVEPGHPDIHQDDGGGVQVDGGQDAAAVAGLADDLDLRGAGQHHRQSGTDQCVVVDDEDADRDSHGDPGMVARSTKSPIALVPCRRSPPTSASRSARPIRPAPGPGGARTEAAAAPGPAGARRASVAATEGGAPPWARRLTISATSPACAVPVTVTSTMAPGACLRALVSPSWTTR